MSETQLTANCQRLQFPMRYNGIHFIKETTNDHIFVNLLLNYFHFKGNAILYFK